MMQGNILRGETELAKINSSDEEHVRSKPKNGKPEIPLLEIPELLRKIRLEASKTYLEAKPRLDLVDIKFTTRKRNSGTCLPFVKHFETNFKSFFGNERVKIHKKKRKRCWQKVTSCIRW